MYFDRIGPVYIFRSFCSYCDDFSEFPSICKSILFVYYLVTDVVLTTVLWSFFMVLEEKVCTKVSGRNYERVNVD